ncbi:hypothetical protein [Jatrophihabitans sp.]|uniref:hypothetical protein n=1 Tax=Jatrophihabitans sp. TaxID=1932789 RepID=UPI002F0D9A3B
MTHASGRWSPRHPDEDELVRAVDASAALRQLLAAASAPPSTAELTGRPRAIADFRAAQRPRAPEPDTEPTCSARGGQPATTGLRRPSRWSARLTVACTALIVLLGGTVATAAAGELPTLRQAMSNLFTDLIPPDDTPPPGGTSSEHPLQPRPGRTGPSSPGSASTGSPASKSAMGGAVERRLTGTSVPQVARSCRSCPVRQASGTAAGRQATPPQVTPRQATPPQATPPQATPPQPTHRHG